MKTKKTLRFLLLVVILLVLFCLFSLVKNLSKKDYKLGCLVGFVDRNLCQILPSLVEIVESNDFEKMLQYQELKTGSNCMSIEDGFCDKQPQITGYEGGAMGSESWISPPDEYLAGLREMTKGNEYKLYRIKINGDEGEVMFLDRGSNSTVVLFVEKGDTEWKISSIGIGRRGIEDFYYL